MYMKLELSGWLKLNEEKDIGVSESKECYSDLVTAVAERVLDNFGCAEFEIGLGTKISTINNANVRIWYSDVECTLEEAMMSVESFLSAGVLLTKGEYVGYSEYTITGFSINDFKLGGHDLDSELRSHLGQYAHIIIEGDMFG